MPALVLPDAGTTTYAGQTVPDTTDWNAIGSAALGTGVVSGCTVGYVSSTAVSVASGTVTVAGTEYSVGAVSSLAVAAANTTDRRDIAIYTVGTGVQVIEGTPCTVVNWVVGTNPPVKPTVPANSVFLGEVYVVGNLGVTANSITRSPGAPPADVYGAAAAVLASSLQKSDNLGDLTNAVTARTNLGLGTLATLSYSGGTAVWLNGAGAFTTPNLGQLGVAPVDAATITSANAAYPIPTFTGMGLGSYLLQHNAAFTVQAATVGASATFLTVQDGTGGRTVSFSSSSTIAWEQGFTAPEPAYAPGEYNIYTFQCFTAGTWVVSWMSSTLFPAASAFAVTSSQTSGGTLGTNLLTPVNAASAPITMTLPTGEAQGTWLAVQKTDSSTNAVTVSGSIRGVGSSTITLQLLNETVWLVADSSGSWWPIASHKTLSSLDARYGGGDLSVPATGSSPEVLSTHLSSPLPVAQGGIGQTSLAAVPVSAWGAATTAVAMSGFKITSLATGTASTDAANVGQLPTASTGLTQTGTAISLTSPVSSTLGGTGRVSSYLPVPGSPSYLSVDDNGLVADTIPLTNLVTTATSTTATSASAPFTAFSGTKYIAIANGGVGGAVLITTFTYVNPTTITLGTAASTSNPSGTIACFGTDNEAACQTFHNSLATATPLQSARVLWPATAGGWYGFYGSQAAGTTGSGGHTYSFSGQFVWPPITQGQGRWSVTWEGTVPAITPWGTSLEAVSSPGVVIFSAALTGSFMDTQTAWLTGQHNPFNNVSPTFRNLTFRMMPNPTATNLNLQACITAELENVTVDTNLAGGPSVTPSTSTSCGLMLPQINNASRVATTRVVVDGYYTNIAASEHWQAIDTKTGDSPQGIVYANSGGHPAFISVQAKECQSTLVAAQYPQGAGLGPSTLPSAGGEIYGRIDAEVASTSASANPFICLVNDSSNQFYGRLAISCTTNGFGIGQINVGGDNLLTIDDYNAVLNDGRPVVDNMSRTSDTIPSASSYPNVGNSDVSAHPTTLKQTWLTIQGSATSGPPAAYASGTTYAIGQSVTSGGNVYLCIAVTTGNAPPNATYWALIGATSSVLPCITSIPSSSPGAMFYVYNDTWNGLLGSSCSIWTELTTGATGYNAGAAFLSNSARSQYMAAWLSAGELHIGNVGVNANPTALASTSTGGTLVAASTAYTLYVEVTAETSPGGIWQVDAWVYATGSPPAGPGTAPTLSYTLSSSDISDFPIPASGRKYAGPYRGKNETASSFQAFRIGPRANVSSVAGLVGSPTATQLATAIGAAVLSDTSLQTFSGPIQIDGALTISGAGVTASTLEATLAGTAGRYVGTVNGASPTGGPYVLGDFAVDKAGAIWVCTTAGSPGTWTNVTAGGAISSVSNSDGTLTISPTTGAVVASRPAITGDATIAAGSNASSVVKIQGVAVTAGEATILSQMTNATTRASSTLPVSANAGEETIVTGSTAGTLTLPASTAQVSSINTVVNQSSAVLTVAAGSGTTISNNGTSGSVSLMPGWSAQFVLISTTWYVLSVTVPATTQAQQYAGSGASALLGWSFDPAGNGSALAATALGAAATIYVSKIPLLKQTVITNVGFDITNAGSGLSNSFGVVFSSSGSVIGQTADQSSSGFTTTGYLQKALASGPFTVAPLQANDFVWAALYVGAETTTMPKFGANTGPGATTQNAGCNTANSRVASVAQANTSTIAAITPSGLTQTGTNYWMCLS